MKKNNVIFWVMMTLLVASCSKAPKLDPTEETIEGKALLRFSIDGFAQETLPFPKSPNLQSSTKPLHASDEGEKPFNLRDYANVIEYKISKYSTLVDSVTQYASDPDFGIYSRYLPVSADTTEREGYHINISAAMLEDGQSLRTKGGSSTLDLSFDPHTPDAFYHYSEVSLPEGSSINSVKIKRIVGKVEVIPTDTIPANAGKVEIDVYDVAKHFLLRKGTGYFVSQKTGDERVGSEIKTISILPEDIGKSEKTFASYFMFKDKLGTQVAPRTVTITTYDKDDNVIMKRVVPNVNLQINQITRLRGPIFSNRPNADFSIEFESDWNSEIPEFEF